MSSDFIKHAKTYGQDGELWLKNIPQRISEYEKIWSLTVLPPFTLTYNYVAPAIRTDGSNVVIKMGFPKEKEFQTEINALEVFNGEGIEKLLEADRDAGVILIERVMPGIPVSELEDEQATKRIASVINRLHKPVPANNTFISISEWTKDLFSVRDWYNGTTGPLPQYLIDKAQSLFTDLIATQATPVLVHGDLHHDNVLSSQRDEWLAIDPKGIIAEPCYETAAMLRNPGGRVLKQSNPSEFLKRRIQLLAEELAFDEQRMLQWAIAQTTLAAIWSMDKNGKGWEEDMAIAEVLNKIKL